MRMLNFLNKMETISGLDQKSSFKKSDKYPKKISCLRGSRGMILASGARTPSFKSQAIPNDEAI